jgi:glycosyltransferase involved in cell wall biosynthesis
MRRVYRRIYAIPDLLLAHTESTRTALISQFGITRDKTALVSHGLNDAVQMPEGERSLAKRALGLPAQARSVLLFGNMSPYKGADLLLDALDDLPDMHLIMAGRCPQDEYGARVRTRVAALVDAGRACWFDGHVDDATVARVFAAADLTALPYRHIDQSGVLLWP